MLSLDEFTERFDTALAARTRGELNAVVVDLPGVQLIGAAPPQPVHHPLSHPHAIYPAVVPLPPPVPQPYPPQVAPHQSSALVRARFNTVTRRGRWFVPPAVVVNSRLSTVTLDFTAAVMATQIVEVFIDDFVSSIALIVPAAATVDMNQLDLVGGATKSRVRNGSQIGPLHLVVRGRSRFGSVTAKHPFGTAFRRAFGSVS